MSEHDSDKSAGYEAVFRERWRDRRSAGARPGELVKQPEWIDAGLVVLGVLLTAGVVAAGTMTIARTQALPAVAQGNSVTAARGDASPAPGSVVHYRDASGNTVDATVVEVTEAEVTARLGQIGPESTGQLLVPADRQRLITLLLPRLR
ncbi:hypothetical protein [Mycobacterium conspicuum]|uniref:hypothetical protein n=1 Tax=Mycobacterium conspicuum TaxID=44010 RepID=UPI000A156A23|nr:hypothetical protein [Mycobacterium conspicuum]ORV43973.1 hypothetical protein AWC00_09920 [Mycobacterium conspicuum]